MPEIKINISKGSTKVSDQSVEVSSNSLTDLLAALKTAKEKSNGVLTKLVEQSKETKQTRRLSSDDDEEDSAPDEEDGRATKRPNIN